MKVSQGANRQDRAGKGKSTSPPSARVAAMSECHAKTKFQNKTSLKHY